PHPSSCRCLEAQREFDLFDEGIRLIEAAQSAATRGNGHACLAGQRARRSLVAYTGDALGSWADEHEVVFLAFGGELGVLCQEAVTGMYGLRAGNQRRCQQVADVEVAATGSSWPDADGFVCQQHCQ